MKATSKVATTEFLSKIINRNKMCGERLNFCEAKASLYEIVKSINSQANKKSRGKYIFTAEFYVHFSTGLAPVLLNVYDSWGKLGTAEVTFRAGIVSVI